MGITFLHLVIWSLRLLLSAVNASEAQKNGLSREGVGSGVFGAQTSILKRVISRSIPYQWINYRSFDVKGIISPSCLRWTAPCHAIRHFERPWETNAMEVRMDLAIPEREVLWLRSTYKLHYVIYFLCFNRLCPNYNSLIGCPLSTECSTHKVIKNLAATCHLQRQFLHIPGFARDG